MLTRDGPIKEGKFVAVAGTITNHSTEGLARTLQGE